MRRLSPKRLTTHYLTALLILAVLSATFHAGLARDLQLSADDAAIINLSGRQRMLSQQILGAAAQYRLRVPGSRDALLVASDTFERNLNRLVDHASAMPTREPARDVLLALYLEGPESVRSQSQLLVQEARALARTPADSPTIVPLSNQIFVHAGAPLLERLEEIVAVLQQQSETNVRSLERRQNYMLAMILLTLIGEALFIFRPMVKGIAAISATLISAAFTDALTGLQSRRAFLETGQTEVDRAHRHQRPLSILMLDIDNFKSINDAHGHSAGDQVLKAVGDAISRTLRSADSCGRLGGEEFAVLLPETGLEGATLVAERIRLSLASIEISHGGTPIPVTVSVGVSQVSTSVTVLADTIAEADIALYQAKSRGRNCVVAANPSSSEYEATRQRRASSPHVNASPTPDAAHTALPAASIHPLPA